MAKKEIDQTQVLNMNEVKETSKIEKKENKSKTFPILLVIIGLLAIGSGAFLLINDSEAYKNKTSSSADETPIVENKDQDSNPKEEADTVTINCSNTQEQDGYTLALTQVIVLKEKRISTLDSNLIVTAPGELEKTLPEFVAIMEGTESGFGGVKDLSGVTYLTKTEGNQYTINIKIDYTKNNAFAVAFNDSCSLG
jgi:hypothetical protein